MRLTHLLAMVLLLLLATGLRTSVATEPAGSEPGLSLFECKARDPYLRVFFSLPPVTLTGSPEVISFAQFVGESGQQSFLMPAQRGPSRAPPGTRAA